QRYLDRLSDGPPLVFCVFNNQDLNQVTWEQRAMGGDPKFPGSQTIPDVPYAAFAELLGLKGIRCESPKKVGDTWEEALSARLPVVLEFKVDAEIAPIPPHIMLDQGKKAAKAAVHDPERTGIVTRGVRQKLAEFTGRL
ncbi:MAG TPA: thiamine pyrophosphate-requiring protein, partial [Streptomyces sp.]|nr:thiamine pyrophosphate-requiring protein [Streptomyces sp.]